MGTIKNANTGTGGPQGIVATSVGTAQEVLGVNREDTPTQAAREVSRVNREDTHKQVAWEVPGVNREDTPE